MRRRTFLEMATLGGVAPSATALNLTAPDAESQHPSIENRFFRVTADLANGTFSVWRRRDPLLVNAHAVIEGARTVWFTDPRYTRTASSSARQLVVRATDSMKEADLELRLTLDDQLDIFFVELVVRNTSARPLALKRMEPVRARLDELSGALTTPGPTRRSRSAARSPRYGSPPWAARISR